MSARVLDLYATAVPTRAAALYLCLLCLAAPSSLRADSSELPGGPSKRTGDFAIGPETGLVIPLSTNRLCPSGVQCIADVGWAVDVAFSYRWANGVGLGFAYEFWMLSACLLYTSDAADDLQPV